MDNMRQIDVTKLLKYYSVCKRYIASHEYASYFIEENFTVEQEDEHRKIIRIVESLIKSIAPSDEYTLLHLHYINGLPIEKCAESMGMARSTGFRLLKRAKDKIYKKYMEAMNE